MNIGKLNKRVTFLERSQKEDDYGDHVNWEPVFTVWATVSPDRTSEPTLRDNVQKPQAGFTIYIRHRKQIRPDMRIAYGGRLFEMVGHPIDMEERHVIMKIHVEEVFEGVEYGR